jgi:hypothetical protein
MPIGCTRLEKLLLAGADCSILKLAFYNLQSFRNLLVVLRGAVATEEELHNVRRHWILARAVVSSHLAGRARFEPAHGVINIDVPFQLGYRPKKPKAPIFGRGLRELNLNLDN